MALLVLGHSTPAIAAGAGAGVVLGTVLVLGVLRSPLRNGVTAIPHLTLYVFRTTTIAGVIGATLANSAGLWAGNVLVNALGKSAPVTLYTFLLNGFWGGKELTNGALGTVHVRPFGPLPGLGGVSTLASGPLGLDGEFFRVGPLVLVILYRGILTVAGPLFLRGRVDLLRGLVVLLLRGNAVRAVLRIGPLFVVAAFVPDRVPEILARNIHHAQFLGVFGGASVHPTLP